MALSNMHGRGLEMLTHGGPGGPLGQGPPAKRARWDAHAGAVPSDDQRSMMVKLDESKLRSVLINRGHLELAASCSQAAPYGARRLPGSGNSMALGAVTPAVSPHGRGGCAPSHAAAVPRGAVVAHVLLEPGRTQPTMTRAHATVRQPARAHRFPLQA